MRKCKEVKIKKLAAQLAYRQDKKKEAYKLWDEAHKMRLELQEKKKSKKKN